MNRSLHRIIGILAVLVMLWLGVTGIWMQGIDLQAQAIQLPMSEPTGLSIIEGMYGQPAFAVVQVSDFSAESLPRNMDLNAAIATVVRAHESADAGAPIEWIELRVIDHVPVGQVMSSGRLTAFDTRTGAAVVAVPPQKLPQGRRLPASLRQRLKTLHRFWSTSDKPGVYFEIVVGLVLWVFLVTGLLMYFQLLSARRRLNRPQLFWMSGGLWRALHRSVSVVAAAFLLVMAFTGTWIGFESTWSALSRRPPGASQPQTSPSFSAAEVPVLAAKTVSAMQALHPDAAVKVFRLRTFGSMQQGVFVDDGQPPNQWVFDAASGRAASLTEPGYPHTNFPFGVQVHEDMKHLHSGAMFGLPTRLMNLFAGLALVFLSISGIVVYVELWRKRSQSGRRQLLWFK